MTNVIGSSSMMAANLAFDSRRVSVIASFIMFFITAEVHAEDRVATMPSVNEIGVGRVDREVSGWNSFGEPLYQFGVRGKQNALVGLVDNGADAPACLTGRETICAFPTALTGQGTLTSAGNQAFGIYGVGKLAVVGTATGAELTAVNNSGHRGDTNLPADTSFGTSTADAIAAMLGCAGANTCANALPIVQDGSVPNSFEHGLYFSPSAVLGYAIFLDADSKSGALNPVMIKYNGRGTALEIKNVGAINSDQPVIYINDSADPGKFFKVLQSGVIENSWWALDPNGYLISHGDAKYQANQSHKFMFSDSAWPTLEIVETDENIHRGIQIAGGNEHSPAVIASTAMHGAVGAPLVVRSEHAPLILGTGSGHETVALDDLGSQAQNILHIKSARLGSPVQISSQGEIDAGISIYGSGTGAVELGSKSSPVKLPAFTVDALPACSLRYRDAVAVVTDASAPAYRAKLSGNGSVRTLAYCDGDSWTAH